MRRIITILTLFSLIITALTSCAKQEHALTSTELLDLGEKYLLELNYEQALVQFTKVIEIEPMNPRGYTGAAESYAALGQHEEAPKILQQGYEAIGSEEIKELLDSVVAEVGYGETELQAVAQIEPTETVQDEKEKSVAEKEEPQLPQPKDGYPKTEQIYPYQGASHYTIKEFNEYGNLIKSTQYNSSDIVDDWTWEYFYDDYQNLIRKKITRLKDSKYSEEFYDLSGRIIEQFNWDPSGSTITRSYDYLGDNSVKITIVSPSYKTSGGGIHEGYEGSLMYQIQSAENMVEAVFGLGSEYNIIEYADTSGHMPVARKKHEFSEQ